MKRDRKLRPAQVNEMRLKLEKKSLDSIKFVNVLIFTGIQIEKKSSPLKFNANRPFFYYIRDTETDNIIFSGRFDKVENE